MRGNFAPQNRIMRLLRIKMAVIAIFSCISLSAGNIKSFHIQLELTPQAKVFVDGLSEDQKSDWLTLIPDSVPLKATAVIKHSGDLSNIIGFKLGTLDGLGDVFEGKYTPAGQNTIEYTSSGEIHYFQLGDITKYKSFTSIAWLEAATGEPLEVVTFIKK